MGNFLIKNNNRYSNDPNFIWVVPIRMEIILFILRVIYKYGTSRMYMVCPPSSRGRPSTPWYILQQSSSSFAPNVSQTTNHIIQDIMTAMNTAADLEIVVNPANPTASNKLDLGETVGSDITLFSR